MKKKMLIFDVDGVLLDNQMGATKEILFPLGKEKEVKIIDEEYQRRKFSGPWGLEQVVSLYKGFSQGSGRLRRILQLLYYT